MNCFPSTRERIYKGMMEKKRGFTDFTRVKVLHKVNKQRSFETTIFLAWVGSRPLVWASQQKIVLGLLNLIIGTNYTEKKIAVS